jgi:hypothetical protein
LLDASTLEQAAAVVPVEAGQPAASDLISPLSPVEGERRVQAAVDAADAEVSGVAEAPAGERSGTAVSKAEASASPAPGKVGEVIPPALYDAYGLLEEALHRIGGRNARAVRDGDVKRKMLEIDRSFDENTLGFGKFTHFLRTAHDSQVIDLNRASAGNYEVSITPGGRKFLPPRVLRDGGAPAVAQAGEPMVTAEAAPEAAVEAGRGGRRDGRRGRGAPRSAAPDLTTPAEAVAAVTESVAPSAEPVSSGSSASPVTPAAAPSVVRSAVPERPIPTVTSLITPAAPAAPAGGFGVRGRRGGRGAPSGPPPILPGQGIPSSAKPAVVVPELPAPVVETVAPAVAAPVIAPVVDQVAASGAVPAEVPAAASAGGESRGRGRGGRGRRGRGGRSGGEDRKSVV